MKISLARAGVRARGPAMIGHLDVDVGSLATSLAEAGLGVFRADLVDRSLHLSATAAALLGLDSKTQTIPLDDVQEFLHDRNEWASVVAFLGPPYRTGTYAEFDLRLADSGGDFAPRWVRAHIAYLNPGGTNPEAVGVIQDVGAERASVFALKQKGELLARAHEVAKLATFELDLERQTISLSPELASMYRAGDEELTLSLEEFRLRFYLEGDRDEKVQEAQTAYQAGTNLHLESRVLCGDGSVIWVRARSTVEYRDDGSSYVLGVVQDVTEEKQVERKLANTAVALERAQALGGVGSWEWYPAESRPFLSDSALGILGYPPGAGSDGLLRRVIHPEDHDFAMGRFFKAVKELGAVDVTFRVLVDDETRWVRLRGGADHDPRTDTPRLSGVLMDVSEQVSAREALEQNVERLSEADAQRRKLMSRLVSAQAEERRLLAAELHDDAIQVLAAHGMQMELLLAHLDDTASSTKLTEELSTVRSLTTRLRHLLFELDPPVLRREGLVAALSDQLRMLREETGAEVELKAEVTQPLSEESSSVAYRIAREALVNIRKHAHAGRVVVSVASRDDLLRMAVEDNGNGFDFEGFVPEYGHLGMSSMRERAELAGGIFSFESEPGRGTKVEIELPADYRARDR